MEVKEISNELFRILNEKGLGKQFQTDPIFAMAAYAVLVEGQAPLAVIAKLCQDQNNLIQELQRKQLSDSKGNGQPG